MVRNFTTLTLEHLQATQPWVLPYNTELTHAVERNAGLGHLLGTHAVLHASKSVGQIAAVFEALDHAESPPDPESMQVLESKAASLVMVAMRLANLYGFSLTRALVEHAEEKNGVVLNWPGGGAYRVEPTPTVNDAKPTEEMQARRAASWEVMRDRLRDGPPIAMPTAEELAADLTKVFASVLPKKDFTNDATYRRLHDFADLLEADGSAHANVLMALFMVYDMSTEKLAADIRSVLGEKP